MARTISILLLTYNRSGDLLELLKNLALQNGTDTVLQEVLVLTNASTDSYKEVTDYIAAHPRQKIRYMMSPDNSGVARGRNTLMQEAKGDLMFILDDDAVLTKPDDLLQLSALFDLPFFIENNTGIITPRVIYYDNKEVQLTAFPHKKYEKYASNPQFLTSYFIGCAHIMKREIIAKTGLYPTDFHYGMEEYDLGYRVLDAGYTIGFDNRVTVEHKESPLGRQPNYKKLQMQWVNKSKVAWRYLPVKDFFTTALSWGVQYLRLAKGNLGTFFVAIGQVVAIPFTEKRTAISAKTLAYLKKVEARLKY